jgi:hypothetical protein
MTSSPFDLPTPDATTPPPDSLHSELEDEAFNELDQLSLKEILDQDSRPTFVIDLDPDYPVGHAIQPIFCNAALRVHDRLLDSITGAPHTTIANKGLAGTATYDEFRTWATGVSRHNNSKDVFPLTLHYQALLWTGSTIRQRWRIISGNALFKTSDIPKGNLQSAPSSKVKTSGGDPKAPNPVKDLASAATVLIDGAPLVTAQKSESTSMSLSKNTSKDTSGSGASGEFSKGTTQETSTNHIPVQVTLSTPDNALPDWTIPNLESINSEHIAFARKVDWASTPLGPMKNWSVQFREIVNLVMRNPHPCSLFWGEELTMIYNEAYKFEVAGNKHPDLMGTGFSGPFSELWDGVAPIFRECARTGHSIRKENDPLPIERYGYLEETFFSWSFVPVYGGTDRILVSHYASLYFQSNVYRVFTTLPSRPPIKQSAVDVCRRYAT